MVTCLERMKRRVRKRRSMERSMKAVLNIIAAAAANTRKRNTSTVASTKNTNMRLRKIRNANENIDTNIRSTGAKRNRPPCRLGPSRGGPKMAPLHWAMQPWMTRRFLKIWRNKEH